MFFQERQEQFRNFFVRFLLYILMVEPYSLFIVELGTRLAGIEDFSIEGQEKVVMDWIAEKGYHTGNIMNAFRLTLVGEGKGPHMFDISWVLGKEETIARMKRAVEVLK